MFKPMPRELPMCSDIVMNETTSVKYDHTGQAGIKRADPITSVFETEFKTSTINSAESLLSRLMGTLSCAYTPNLQLHQRTIPIKHSRDVIAKSSSTRVNPPLLHHHQAYVVVDETGLSASLLPHLSHHLHRSHCQINQKPSSPRDLILRWDTVLFHSAAMHSEALSDLTIQTDLEKEQVNGFVKIHVEIVKATKVVTFNSPAELLDDAFTKHVVDVRRRATHKCSCSSVTPDVTSQAQYALDTKRPTLRDFGAGVENWGTTELICECAADFVNDQLTAAALRLDGKLSSLLVEVAVPDAGLLNLVHELRAERGSRHPEAYLKDLDGIVWYNDPDDAEPISTPRLGALSLNLNGASTSAGLKEGTCLTSQQASLTGFFSTRTVVAPLPFIYPVPHQRQAICAEVITDSGNSGPTKQVGAQKRTKASVSEGSNKRTKTSTGNQNIESSSDESDDDQDFTISEGEEAKDGGGGGGTEEEGEYEQLREDAGQDHRGIWCMYSRTNDPHTEDVHSLVFSPELTCICKVGPVKSCHRPVRTGR
ncbi:hypothetical protein EDB84DRAFT_1441804 [Lactarius hengduanensis]|nr:hypothetical protein EDB84DRAFT_1441804 [Lactarius hengduanensis]